MPAEGPIRLLVLQPTPFCPFACRYCYLPSRHDRRVIQPAVLERVFAEVLRSGLVAERLDVVWHAGEPLVLPPRWYRDAFRCAARLTPSGIHLTHGLQTSGVGLSAGWIDLLRDWPVRLGLSLDGPQDLHDRNRITRTGKGTHAVAMRAVERLTAADIPFHVITVLTRAHLDQPDRLYDFYVTHGIRRVCFNVEEIEGTNGVSSLAGAEAEAAFRRFFRRLLERCAEQPERLAVREIDQSLGALLFPDGAPPNEQVVPFGILSVAVDGRVSTFSPELLGCHAVAYDDFILGDLTAEPLQAILERALTSRLAAAVAAGVAACRQRCAYFPYCGGGAPANKWFETGRFDSTETMFCRLAKQAVIDETLAFLERRLRSAAGSPLALAGTAALNRCAV